MTTRASTGELGRLRAAAMPAGRGCPLLQCLPSMTVLHSGCACLQAAGAPRAAIVQTVVVYVEVLEAVEVNPALRTQLRVWRGATGLGDRRRAETRPARKPAQGSAAQRTTRARTDAHMHVCAPIHTGAVGPLAWRQPLCVCCAAAVGPPRCQTLAAVPLSAAARRPAVCAGGQTVARRPGP